MPSSSGTFSSRNRAVGQAQRERVRHRERKTSADPFFQLPRIRACRNLSSPLCCFCKLVPLWAIVRAYSESGGDNKKEKESNEDADGWKSCCLRCDWVCGPPLWPSSWVLGSYSQPPQNNCLNNMSLISVLFLERLFFVLFCLTSGFPVLESLLSYTTQRLLEEVVGVDCGCSKHRPLTQETRVCILNPAG